MTSNSPFFSGKKDKKRSGVSPVISTVILIGVTVTLGLSLWSYSVSQVNTSTLTFANEVTDYVNYVNDRFVVVNIAFRFDAVNEAPNPDKCPNDNRCASIWIYNHGTLPVTITNAFFGDSPTNSPDLTNLGMSPSPVVIQPKTMGVFTVVNGATALNPAGQDFTSGTTYYVKVISTTSAQQSYFQGAD